MKTKLIFPNGLSNSESRIKIETFSVMILNVVTKAKSELVKVCVVLI